MTQSLTKQLRLVSRRFSFPFLLILTASAYVERPALAIPDELCIPVRAKINALFVDTDCDSPVGLCTAGRIKGGGILNGTTRFTALGIAPAAGMPGIEPDSTLSYNGVLEISTRHGDLTISDVGVFDQNVGVFSEIDRITAGTGRFDKANGTLFIYGNAFADGSGFEGKVRGQICFVP